MVRGSGAGGVSVWCWIAPVTVAGSVVVVLVEQLLVVRSRSRVAAAMVILVGTGSFGRRSVGLSVFWVGRPSANCSAAGGNETRGTCFLSFFEFQSDIWWVSLEGQYVEFGSRS